VRATLSLESRFESIEVAERALVDLCVEGGVGADEEYWILTALREAIANAIRHGHRGITQESVRVEYRIQGEEVSISVADQGDGFDPAVIPDPRDAENLLKPCGRGIFYMRRFMDDVEFRSGPGGGTIVTMTRKVTSRSIKE
jgi:serine/threonine-protein kinase RsbW